MSDFLHAPLFTLGSTEVTPYGLFVVAIGLVSGWALGRLLLMVLRRGRAHDELPWWFLPRTFEIALAALGLAVGLDRAGLVGLDVLSVAVARVLRAPLYEIGGSPLTLGLILTVLLIVALSYGISRALQRAITAALRDRGLKDEGNIAVILRLAHYVVVLVGVLVGLNTAGIKLGALLAAGAVFAVGIGLALQSLAQNFVSGIILLVEGSIHPGDVLEVQGELVQVRRMGIRSTVVRTKDDDDMILPNSVLVQEAVRNLTLLDNELRVRVMVGVHYDSDLELVFRILRRVAREFPRRTDREPQVFLRDFGASSVDFEVCIWTREPFLRPGLQSQLRLAIWHGLKRADIVIAYPQVDVHLDPDVVRAVRGGARPDEEDEEAVDEPDVTPGHWRVPLGIAARAGSGRDRLRFDAVRPLVAAMRRVGSGYEVEFLCPESRVRVTTRVDGDPVAPAPRSALAPVLRRVLGRAPDDAAAVTVDADLLGTEAGRAVVMRAFQSVIAQFAWDPTRERWVGHVAAGEALSPFERMVSMAPMQTEHDREVAARILVEVASADGEIEEEERAFFAEFTGDESGLDRLLAMPPLSPQDLSACSRGSVRETMLLLGYALALTDAELEKVERERLAGFATGLDVPDANHREVRRIAAMYVLEGALDALDGNGDVDAVAKEARALGHRLGLSRADINQTELRWRHRRGL